VLDSNNRLTISDSVNNTGVQQTQPTDSNNIPHEQVMEPQPVITPEKLQVNTGFNKLEITTISGKKASILLPSDSAKEDIEKLIKLLRVFSPE